jgi:hypothetical protein
VQRIGTAVAGAHHAQLELIEGEPMASLDGSRGSVWATALVAMALAESTGTRLSVRKVGDSLVVGGDEWWISLDGGVVPPLDEVLVAPAAQLGEVLLATVEEARGAAETRLDSAAVARLDSLADRLTAGDQPQTAATAGSLGRAAGSSLRWLSGGTDRP